MFLMKAYGKGTVAAGMALLMYFSMVINESRVVRTSTSRNLPRPKTFWMPTRSTASTGKSTKWNLWSEWRSGVLKPSFAKKNSTQAASFAANTCRSSAIADLCWSTYKRSGATFLSHILCDVLPSQSVGHRVPLSATWPLDLTAVSSLRAARWLCHLR